MVFDPGQLNAEATVAVHPATAPAIIGAFFLLLAYLGGQYELYVVMRWAVTAAAILVAAIAGGQGRTLWAAVFAAIAVLFNPLVPVYATREFWIPFDVAGLVLFCVAGVKLRASGSVRPEFLQGVRTTSSTYAAPGSEARSPVSIHQTTPAAGWYMDPNNPTHQRWWDGRTWTRHTQVKAGTKRPTNPVAVTGFGLGLASFFLFSIPVFGLVLSLAAIVVSAMGLPQTHGTAKKYRVFAILGLILGIVYAFMALLYLVTGR
ncbi:DUF6804 family protein [Paenarthrobacter sp. NPDC090522]|uniref:DUF6804 family protein n=1 Tax=Paenarthrobacter sp. NPDC090522 TaxID=3364383 RepID=UPI00380A566C